MLHKFFVVVDDPAYREEIHQELMSARGNDVIPERAVEPHNLLEGSEYNGIFYLTQEEADLLMSDIRVRAVHRDPLEIGVRKSALGTRAGVYWRDGSVTIANTHKNWGLIRSNFQYNNYSNLNTTSSQFTYNLDGTGVDIIVMDSGVEPGHPEFAVNADGTGGSRVIDHDWTQYGYITSVPAGGFLGDYDGHGSNCASIAAGNTCGWAPGAKIYSLRCVPGDSVYSIYDGRFLDILDNFDCWRSIRAFHAAKTVDPITGYKRPTVVTASFGYNYRYTRVTAITYQGNTYSVSTTTGAYGTIGVPQGGIGIHGYRYIAEDAEIASTIAAGIIVVSAAGNDRHKIDVPGGQDYNNTWTDNFGWSEYYHRGATPSATAGVINVGCMAAFANTVANSEHKRNFSCAGPRVDIWAPGDYIMGAYANAPYAVNAIADPRNSAYYLNKISGTSQACPQVSGVISCVLQMRPWFTATDVLNWLKAVSPPWPVNESYYGGSGYTNFGSLQGGPNRALYMPYNLPDPVTIRG
jgi:hypothetical protein